MAERPLERPLRILQVSTADRQGGAEQVAWNLFLAYRRYGHDSRLAVGIKRGNDPDVQTIPNQALRGRWYGFFHKLSLRWQQKEESGADPETPLSHLAGIMAEPARRFNYYHGLEDFHYPGTSRLLELNGPPDILHAHNLHGAYFDLRQLPQLSRQVPLLLTLHDAWLLSGHCAHSFGCEKWKTGCGRCPDLTIYPPIERDATASNWRRKAGIFAQSRLYIATPCHWLMQKVEQSMLAPAVIESRIVPNGVDLNIFKPAERHEARARLGIPQDAKVLLAVGVKIRESAWRDFETLTEVVARVSASLEEQKVLLIALGQEAPPDQPGRPDVRFVPFQNDTAEIARYYQAADVYLHIARADTFPTAIIEAMACATPVVATAVGGIPEQIEDAWTGFLAPAGDTVTLAERVGRILSDPDLKRNMARRAEKRARQKYDLSQQVKHYLDWYLEMRPETEPAAQKIFL